MSNEWIPIHNSARKHLPKDRPYTKIEAMFEYNLDAIHKNIKSTNEYAKAWMRSRNWVRSLINNSQPLKDSLWTEKGQPKSTNTKPPQPTVDRKRTTNGQAKRYPTLEEIKEYCAEKGYDSKINPELYFTVRDGDDWIKANKKPVKDWKRDLHAAFLAGSFKWDGNQGNAKSIQKTLLEGW